MPGSYSRCRAPSLLDQFRTSIKSFLESRRLPDITVIPVECWGDDPRFAGYHAASAFGPPEKYYLKQNAADQALRIAEKLGYATATSTQPSETGETTEVVQRQTFARVAELADALDLGSSGETRGCSNHLSRILFHSKHLRQQEGGRWHCYHIPLTFHASDSLE